jgi:hypothetical protein
VILTFKIGTTKISRSNSKDTKLGRKTTKNDLILLKTGGITIDMTRLFGKNKGEGLIQERKFKTALDIKKTTMISIVILIVILQLTISMNKWTRSMNQGMNQERINHQLLIERSELEVEEWELQTSEAEEWETQTSEEVVGTIMVGEVECNILLVLVLTIDQGTLQLSSPTEMETINSHSTTTTKWREIASTTRDSK